MPVELPDQFALWDDAIRRSAVDAEFRQRLLDSPNDALQEMGIDTGLTTIIVHEFRDDEQVLILPPLIERGQQPQRPRDARPAAGPPSPPMVGVISCALLDAADDRVYYGSQAGGQGNG